MFVRKMINFSGIFLVAFLSACVTTLPQKNVLTPVNRPLVNAPSNYPDVTDKSSLNRSGATQKSVNLQKTSTSPIAVKVPQNNRNGVLSVNGPDWTKLFKSWENACADSPEIVIFEKHFTNYDEKLFLPKLGKVNLPAIYKSATGAPSTKVHGDHSEFILPVTAGTYYGISVKSIGVYIGHENGIGGKYVVLNASEKDVKQALKKHKVLFKKRIESEVYQASVSGDTKEAVLTCDHSM